MTPFHFSFSNYAFSVFVFICVSLSHPPLGSWMKPKKVCYWLDFDYFQILIFLTGKIFPVFLFLFLFHLAQPQRLPQLQTAVQESEEEISKIKNGHPSLSNGNGIHHGAKHVSAENRRLSAPVSQKMHRKIHSSLSVNSDISKKSKVNAVFSQKTGSSPEGKCDAYACFTWPDVKPYSQRIIWSSKCMKNVALPPNRNFGKMQLPQRKAQAITEALAADILLLDCLLEWTVITLNIAAILLFKPHLKMWIPCFGGIRLYVFFQSLIQYVNLWFRDTCLYFFLQFSY